MERSDDVAGRKAGGCGPESAIVDRVRGVARRQARTVIAWAGRRGLVRPLWWLCGIEQVRDVDLFIASYPRSGNTWTRYVIAYLQLGTDRPLRHDEVAAVAFDAYHHTDRINATEGRRIVKIHQPLLDACPRVIYVHRDIREALVSYWFFARRRHGYTDSFSRFIRGPIPHQHGSWKEHMTACRRRMETDPESILVVRYRDLLERFPETVRRIADWSGIGRGVDPEAVRRLTMLETMADEERKAGSLLPNRDGGYFFDDRGAGHRWRDYWSADDLAWLARDRTLMRLLEEFGYR